MPIINDYTQERVCEYKGRRYLVRDNGAVFRLPKEGGRLSKLDNVWSFGTKNSDGYMIFTGNVRVHQVVCTAFHGPEPEPHMVVDHIDTNRCNNRPENLRWVTRLENVIYNPVTRKKIIYHCGSIEAFLADPTILRSKVLTPDIAWMRTVTKEEAEKCKRNIERWANENSSKLTESSGKGLGGIIFSNEEMAEAAEWNKYNPNKRYKPYSVQKAEIEEANRRDHEEQYGLKDSLTPGAKQLNWKTSTEFLLCPTQGQERTLSAYLNNLVKDKVFTRTQYGDGGVVLDYGINEKENALFVLTQNGDDEKDRKTIKPWALCRITLQDGYFIHDNQGSFFHEDGGQKYFTLAMGREWTGGEVFDDFVD